MTSVRVFIFCDDQEALKDILVCGIKYASKKKINNKSMEVIWICETEDVCEAIAECNNYIDSYQLELYNAQRGPLMPYYHK